MAKIYIKTMGCKVNTYDSHALETSLRQKGHTVLLSPDSADVCIINSCSVTAKADRESRYWARKFRKNKADTKVVATGCYAQTDSKNLLDMEEIDLVVPNQDKDRLVEVLENRIKTGFTTIKPEDKLPEGTKPVSKNRQGHFKSSLKLLAADSSQTRSFLKIQDGCNGFCTYCLIPFARGQSRSVTPEEVKEEVRRQIDNGINEIVFTGIHIGDYGRDISSNKDAEPFAQLLEELFCWPDMVRVRISSLEPAELSDRLLEVLKANRDLVCPHFHFPLQSGNNRILKLMRRTYTKELYQQKVKQAREAFPDAFFGADVIPGFPSETDEEFQETVHFLKELNLSEIHVFPYSKRPGTAAAKMPHHIDLQVVKERATILRTLSTDLKKAFIRSQLESQQEVLWEGQCLEDGRRTGRTRNYIDVVSRANNVPLANSLSQIKLAGFYSEKYVLGQIT